MREIKFRVWKKDERIWANENYLFDNCLNIYSNNGTFIPEREEFQLVVQQYTGRRDKNGKEVYEGDCIKNSDGLVLSVKWNRKLCCFAASRSTEDGWMNLLESLMDDFEVIGNISENPSLIK